MIRLFKQLSQQTQLLFLAFLCLMGSSLFVSWHTFQLFTPELQPAIQLKSQTIQISIQNTLEKALNEEIPFQHLKGVPAYLDEIKKEHPEIIHIQIQSIDQKIQYQNTHRIQQADAQKSADYPLYQKGQKVAVMRLWVDAHYSEKRMLDILLDILTVIAVSLIIAFELLMFIVTFNVAAPLEEIEKACLNLTQPTILKKWTVHCSHELAQFVQKVNQLIEEVIKKTMPSSLNTVDNLSTDGQRPERVEYIRWPFFLLIFSDSLSLSFFPLYVDQVYTPLFGLTREIIVGLPISLFMLFWALSLPSNGVWSDTLGRRKAFLIGATITTVGLTLTAFAQGILDLLLWRCFTAVGYSLVFITVQGYVTDNTTPENRSQGMATFVSTFFAGSLTGAAIGGILADRMAMNHIFLLSSLLSALSALFVFKFLSKQKPRLIKPKLRWVDFKKVCSDAHFLMITLFSAIPSKMALTGFLYYSAPLFLNSMGSNQSTAGRVIMAYGLMIIFLSPFVARWSDRFHARESFIIMGGLLAMAAIGLDGIHASIPVFILSIILLGMAHAVGVPTQLTLITEINPTLCEEVGLGTVIGLYRLMERGGNILGPLLAGTLIASFGFQKAYLYMGFLLGSCTLILMAYLKWGHTPSVLQKEAQS